MKSILRLLPAILWTIALFVLTLIPASDIPSTIFDQFEGFDKLVHFAIFSGFTFLWTLTFRHQNLFLQLLLLLFITGIGIGVGLGIEYLQRLFVGLNRSFDRYDWYADALGALFGAGLFCGLLFVDAVNKFSSSKEAAAKR